MRYESAGDANARLSNSLVSLKTGEPFLVIGCESAVSIVGTNLHTRKNETHHIDEINLVPVKLGYVNVGKSVVYVMRKPTRKYQQGLNRYNMVVKQLGKTEPEKADDFPRIRFERPQGLDYAGEDMCNTVMGKYPDLGEAFRRVRSGKVSAMAFSREWAVGTEGVDTVLYHKANVVGFVGKDSVKLLPEYAFLKESLEETFNGHY